MTVKTYLTDLEIASQATIQPIAAIAEKAGIPEEAVEQYGRYKAKIDPLKISTEANAKVVLVTAINPTPAGEGKSTVTVGLSDALNQLGKNVVVALREPSLGPVFGVKGGATGGGYAQVLPMEDINLHFTGDLHAITSANNLLAACIDNHLHQGNDLNIDPRRITWKRVVDLNDRSLRNVTIGLGGPLQGVPRQDGFDITVASEIMAIFCLATSIEDLKARIAFKAFIIFTERKIFILLKIEIKTMTKSKMFQPYLKKSLLKAINFKTSSKMKIARQTWSMMKKIFLYWASLAEVSSPSEIMFTKITKSIKYSKGLSALPSTMFLRFFRDHLFFCLSFCFLKCPEISKVF